MDAVEYVKTKRRMCATFHRCLNCPIKGNCGSLTDPEGNVKAVEKWAKEHPVKTRTTKLLEDFPNVNVYNGFPDICPKRLDPSYEVKCHEVAYCVDCLREYWLEEIE